MSGKQVLLNANDKNMKQIRKDCDGRIELQAIVISVISTWFEQQAELQNNASGDSKSLVTMCGQLVTKRRHSQANKAKDKSNKRIHA